MANARLGGFWERRKWWAKAYFQAQYKTSRFNTRYYGLELEDTGAGVELGVGASFMYSVASNFFVFARGEAALLDGAARDVSFVNRDLTAQGFLGFGFKNDRTRTTPSVQTSKRYLRLAHGWVTPSSLAEIMSFKAESDPDNHQMTSVFYGHPLSDTLLGIPIQVYMHTGLGWYWANRKPGVLEFVVAAKLYYTIPLPVRLKLGFAEGWSWVTDIPYVEDTELRAKGYEPSPLLNYLDFSVDVNMGDLFGWIGARETLDRTWLGYDIHHRSAIFETAQQFGRIKGGSNVQMVYLQYDF
jgi:outer membrane protein